MYVPGLPVVVEGGRVVLRGELRQSVLQLQQLRPRVGSEEAREVGCGRTEQGGGVSEEARDHKQAEEQEAAELQAKKGRRQSM